MMHILDTDDKVLSALFPRDGRMCRLDFVIADIMGMKFVRTKTLAEGAELCDL